MMSLPPWVPVTESEGWGLTPVFHLAEDRGIDVALLTSAVFPNLPSHPWGFGGTDLPSQPWGFGGVNLPSTEVEGFFHSPISDGGGVVIGDFEVLNQLLAPYSHLLNFDFDPDYSRRLQSDKESSLGNLRQYLRRHSPQSMLLGILKLPSTRMSKSTLTLPCTPWDIAPVLHETGYCCSRPVDGSVMTPEESVASPKDFFSGFCFGGNSSEHCLYVQIVKGC